ncbi:MAG: hypothetical protein OEX19_03215 [Gammaproteobacteria bacterium]|nr:hypothetical protein [Gammaproteobacteria bacterium]
MKKSRQRKRFKLEITEAAYEEVIHVVNRQGVNDPLPVLNYNEETNEYEIGAYSPAYVDEKKKYLDEDQKLTYQVGRLIMCIEDPEIVKQVDGKKLDYADKKFFIR